MILEIYPKTLWNFPLRAFSCICESLQDVVQNIFWSLEDAPRPPTTRVLDTPLIWKLKKYISMKHCTILVILDILIQCSEVLFSMHLSNRFWNYSFYLTECITIIWICPSRGCFLTSSLIGTMALGLVTPISVLWDISVNKVCHFVMVSSFMQWYL